MKHFKIVLLAGLVSGCAAPQNTVKELNDKQASGLNVYKDNVVAYYMPDDSMYKNHIYAWTKNSDKIIAFSINGIAYNLKDIKSISFNDEKNKNIIIVNFINGTTIKSQNDKSNPKKYSFDKPQWLLCDTSKKCTNFVYFDYANSQSATSFTEKAELIGVYAKDIGKDAKVDRTNIGKISFINEIKFREDSAVLPINKKITILNEEEIKKLKSDIDLALNAASAFKAKEDEERKKKIEANRQAEDRLEKESLKMRKNIKIGTETNCGQVFDVRPPMAGVQTIQGMHFIAIDKLYIPGAGCRFVNGQYIGR